MPSNTDGKTFAEVQTDSDLINETFVRTVVLERICLELVTGFSTLFEDEAAVRGAFMQTVRERFQRENEHSEGPGHHAFIKAALRNVDLFERTLLAYTGDAEKLSDKDKQ